MQQLQGDLITYRIAMGPHTGRKVLALQIGEDNVPVALSHIGPLGTGDNRGVLNVNETYFVGMTEGDRRSQSSVWGWT